MNNALTQSPMAPPTGAAPEALPTLNPLLAAVRMPAPQMAGVPAQPPPAIPPLEKVMEAQKHNNYMGQILNRLLVKPDLTTKDVLSAMTDAVKNGSLSAQQAATQLASMPSDSIALRAWLRAHHQQNMGIGRRIHELSQIAQPSPASAEPEEGT